MKEYQIPKEKLETFAGEQYHIVSSDLRSISYLLAVASNETTRGFFWFVIQGEVAALERLHDFAHGLGMDMTLIEVMPLGEIEEAIDLFFGPLIYRMLVGHASIDDNSIVVHSHHITIARSLESEDCPFNLPRC